MSAGAKFTSGNADDGRVTLVRDDLTTAELLGVLIFLGTLTDNEDGTTELTLGGS